MNTDPQKLVAVLDRIKKVSDVTTLSRSPYHLYPHKRSMVITGFVCGAPMIRVGPSTEYPALRFVLRVPLR